MSPSLSKAGRRLLGTAAAIISLVGMAVGLSGCPVASDLENQERFTSLNAGATSTGGTGTGGSGMGGSGGSGMSCAVTLPDPTTFPCNWRAALGGPGQSPQGYCYKSGCHSDSTAAGDLDLTPNEFLAWRLLNVPAARKITCPDGTACDPDAPACDKCMTCTAGGAPVLIDTANPGQGWIFDKMEQFIPGTTTRTMSIGCGDAMPTFNTTATNQYTEAHKQCLIQFFTALASTPGTWPCGMGAGGSGTGGTGTGGTATGGTATGGAGGT